MTSVKYIEETLIIFNNKLKDFIKEFKLTFPELIRELNKNNTIEGFMTVNKLIRDLFDKKKDLLDIKGNKLYKNDYFALFLCLSCDLSICYNWVDIEKQYDIMRYINERYDISGNKMQVSLCNIDENRQTVYCSCGKNCIAHNCFILTNPYTDISIFVACHCLTKVCSDKEIRKQIIKKLEIIKLQNSTYVVSINNNNNKNEMKQEAKTKQKLEEKLKRDNRECKSCKKYCIPINEPERKQQCYSCYTITGKCFIKIKK